jgi:hypothetical protein
MATASLHPETRSAGKAKNPSGSSVKRQATGTDTSGVSTSRSSSTSTKSLAQVLAVFESLPPANRTLLAWAMERLNEASSPAQVLAAKKAMREALTVRTKEQATRTVRSKVA